MRHGIGECQEGKGGSRLVGRSGRSRRECGGADEGRKKEEANGGDFVSEANRDVEPRSREAEVMEMAEIASDSNASS